MLIRTQDREALIVFDNILSVTEEYCCGFYDVEAILPLSVSPFGGDDPSVWLLGKYSTREKALKVLDMIQHLYVQTSQIQGDMFQMPQDSDVDE